MNYSWDFGDNGSSSAQDPQHKYLAGGIYTVKLIAVGKGGTNSTTKTISIQNTPITCKINIVQLIAMPFVDGSGVSWDPFDGPDVFLKSQQHLAVFCWMQLQVDLVIFLQLVYLWVGR